MVLGSSGGNGVCEPLTMTADHVRPVWDGGQTVSGNIVAACYECNQARGQVTNRTRIRTEYDLASTAAVWRGMMPTERCCGSCSLCCRLPSIAALEKPIDTWCMHCRPGNGGCSIYADRPPACRTFNCGWLEPHIWNGLLLLTEEWFPARCHFYLTFDDVAGIAVHVDPDFPDAWRAEPYHSALWNLPAPVSIRIGRRSIWLNKATGAEEVTVRTQAQVDREFKARVREYRR
jgi:uncharacterized protein